MLHPLGLAQLLLIGDVIWPKAAGCVELEGGWEAGVTGIRGERGVELGEVPLQEILHVPLRLPLPQLRGLLRRIKGELGCWADEGAHSDDVLGGVPDGGEVGGVGDGGGPVHVRLRQQGRPDPLQLHRRLRLAPKRSLWSSADEREWNDGGGEVMGAVAEVGGEALEAVDGDAGVQAGLKVRAGAAGARRVPRKDWWQLGGGRYWGWR